MLLHNLILFIGQARWFVQDLRRNHKLAKVVKQSSHHKLL
jgi:hypothetical protein